jgi:hypothetical protein
VREFWASADSTEYLDWSKAKPVFFPNPKPSSRMISIRLPKILLAEKVQESLGTRKRKGKAA